MVVKGLIRLNKDTLSLQLLNVKDSKLITLKNDFINHPIDNIRWAVSKGPAKIDNITVVKLLEEK